MILKISGQIYGGKNNMKISKTGRHYPNKSWSIWRDSKVYEVKQQLKKLKDFDTITEPVSVEIHYTNGDNRRRDIPAIIDSIWHILEKCNVVSDDTLLGNPNFLFFHRGLDKKNAGVEIIIGEE